MEANEQNRSIFGPGFHMSLPGDPITLTAFGSTYRFEWHNYLGPHFVNKRGDELKRPPGERNKWWVGFDLWFRQGKRTKNGVCLFDMPENVPTDKPGVE